MGWRGGGVAGVGVVLGGWVVGGVGAQDEGGACYGAGSVAGAALGTLVVTLAVLASGLFFYKMYWRNRKGKHSVLVTDTESPDDQYAFDNPCFREAASVKHLREEGSKADKGKWPGWPPVHTFRKEHKVSLDDSCVSDSRLRAVTLRSHDFTGLGFNICGNMRDGIFVKDVLHRGPAFESGRIGTGDRIDSVCISFRNMVFEDALTILSYASPYDVQVHLENDSCSRPSTLMRSKRESSAVTSSERILHPKFTRSQSVPHSKEVGNCVNKKFGHQSGLVPEKNRMNHSPSNKASSPGNKSRSQKMSPLADTRGVALEPHQTKSSDSQNKLHKFGIKVLPISINPKMGVQSVMGAKKAGTEGPPGEEKPKEPSRTGSPLDEHLSAEDEQDAGKENVKAMLAKGLLSLKEKINQNSLGRKRKAEEESGAEYPVPRRRSLVACGVKVYEESAGNVPEEVFRAGDVARTQRKSVAEGRKGGEEGEEERGASESEESSDRESSREEAKRGKRSKGKAPSPPQGGGTWKEINEMRSEEEVSSEKTRIFEPEPKAEEEGEGRRHQSYDSDSDMEEAAAGKDSPATKIELSATQVTVHHSPAGDGNEDEVERGRKAASLGDLSRLDSEQPLSIVLERAVSLDLTEGTSQCAKKRKAPLPPSEEFPQVFDERPYRKENRLEGLTTFQRRLKKSSDFGTLEDALHDDSKPNDTLAPNDLSEAHSYNIQEFSSWLAECRRPKAPQEDAPTPPPHDPKLTATSFVNINSTDRPEGDDAPDDNYNVSFRVNGTHVPNPPENLHFAPPTSRTVVLISQPNSLDPAPTPAPDPHSQNANGSYSSASASPSLSIPNTLSSPLSSPLTYVTEIKVSTPERPERPERPEPPEPPEPHPDTPSLVSVTDRIHAFDSLDPPNAPFAKPLPDVSKIPIRTMKSETGQRVLATIQSLAKESSPSGRSPQGEYAKRVASLFSNARLGEVEEGLQSEGPRLNVSELYLKPSPPKPSKEYSSSGKVPPVVPPRKSESAIVSSSRVTVGLGGATPECRERNVVTLSSFVGRDQGEEGVSSKVCLGMKRGGEVNGREEGVEFRPGDAKEGL